MTKTQDTLRPSPALFAGFIAAATLVMIGAYAPLVIVALRIIS